MGMNWINQNIADIFVQLQNMYDGACIGTLLDFVKDLQALRENWIDTDKDEKQRYESLKRIIPDMEELA